MKTKTKKYNSVDDLVKKSSKKVQSKYKELEKKDKSNFLIVNGIICPNCHDKVFSRAQHDMRWCSCGEVAIDGGFSGYCRTAFKTKPPERVEILVDATKEELYDDWNKSKDKFGVIKHEN